MGCAVRSGLVVVLLTVGISGTALAVNIPAGSDLWVTVPETSYQDFSALPLPPTFFGAGSDPFSGRVDFAGQPIAPATGLGPTDTVVERLALATIVPGGTPVTIPIEIVALNLVSVSPITVTFNGGASSSTYSVKVCIDPAAAQPGSTMTIHHENEHGGSFTSDLNMVVHMTFTKTSGVSGVASVSLSAPLDFPSTTRGYWLLSVPAPFSSPTIGAPLVVPNNCGGLGAYTIPPTSSNFFAGYRKLDDDPDPDPLTCYGKFMSCHDAQLYAHGVLPPQTPTPPGGEGVKIIPGGDCLVTTPGIAAACPGPTFCGINTHPRCTVCDCSEPQLPAATPWGVWLMCAVLLLVGGWFIYRQTGRPQRVE